MTLYSKNYWGLDISDHHDVTEEDMQAASFNGDDFAFWTMFEGEPARVKRPVRSAEWWRQYHASRIRRED